VKVKQKRKRCKVASAREVAEEALFLVGGTGGGVRKRIRSRERSEMYCRRR